MKIRRYSKYMEITALVKKRRWMVYQDGDAVSAAHFCGGEWNYCLKNRRYIKPMWCSKCNTGDRKDPTNAPRWAIDLVNLIDL